MADRSTSTGCHLASARPSPRVDMLDVTTTLQASHAHARRAQLDRRRSRPQRHRPTRMHITLVPTRDGCDDGDESGHHREHQGTQPPASAGSALGPIHDVRGILPLGRHREAHRVGIVDDDQRRGRALATLVSVERHERQLVAGLFGLDVGHPPRRRRPAHRSPRQSGNV
jgi:hypothetical protein